MKSGKIKSLVMKLLKISLIFFLYSVNALSSSSNIKIPEKINISINNEEYRKYVKNLYNAYIKSTKNSNYIFNNFKDKKFKGKIKFDNKNYLDCDLKITGEWNDHIDLPLASIKVNIGKGSYYGIRKFKLFLLKTRHDEREVFWNALMRFHGYKTLFTKKITVNLDIP